ncbi:MAG TPA: hypothetical protein VHN15_00380, partial [Thermoanaerobaculia bacterium]|nr:hypothetical protein [Thermoanaerobaculia bacterium]
MKAFLAVLTLLFLFPFLGAAERAPELVFEASGRYEGLARQLGELPRERLEFITALVGLEDPGPPIRVILAPENSLEARVPGWVAGYALGSESTIVLLPARSPSYPDKSFEDLLRHEVAHIL